MIKMFFYLLISCISSYAVYTSSNIDYSKINKKEETKIEKAENYIMKIEIPSINLSGKIYSKDSKENNIDKNIVIMDDSSFPDEDGGIVIIGAHSGIGKIAYFKNLDKIKIKDNIDLIYNNKKYTYTVNKIYLDSKDGSIVINNYTNSNKLYLYTCNPNDKNNYLVVVSERI